MPRCYFRAIDDVDTLSQNLIDVRFREICETLDFKFPDISELTPEGRTYTPAFTLFAFRFRCGFFLDARCCGGLFATTSMARPKRPHAFSYNSIFIGSVLGVFAMPTTESQRAARTMYCNLMFEVRARLDFIVSFREGQYKLPDRPSFELCYVELRMICELVALACLTVQGDSPRTRDAKIRSAHQADYILNRLGTSHSEFYPQPGSPIDTDRGHTFVPSKSEFMTKTDLLSLYWKCGDMLHRGDFESIEEVRPIDFGPIDRAIMKLIELLKFHKISFFGTTDEMWVIMNDPETGKVSATLERLT